MPTKPLNGQLVSREDLTDELAVFKIRYQDGDHPGFEPGQFITIGLPEDPATVAKGKKPKLVRRAYSIASSPNDRDHLELYVVRVQDGALTPLLWKLQPGDPLFMAPRITGTFTLDGVPDGKVLVMVSTGTGLAPYMSMLRTYRHTDRWEKFVVVHGARFSADLSYKQELEQIADDDPSVMYLPSCTREPAESPWPPVRGRVHTCLRPDVFDGVVGEPLTPERCHVFLCGNPAMIDQAEEELTARGFTTKKPKNPDGNIHLERYW
jgi:ferredoxin--NADP+ reductase